MDDALKSADNPRSKRARLTQVAVTLNILISAQAAGLSEELGATVVGRSRKVKVVVSVQETPGFPGLCRSRRLLARHTIDHSCLLMQL